MARDEKVVIRLTDDVKAEFQTVAESMGMTISSLGSYVIGDYLRRLKNDKVIMEKMAAQAVTYFADQSMEKMFGGLDETKVLNMVGNVVKDLGIGSSQTSSEG